MIERHPPIDPAHPGEILREDILPTLAMSNTAVADALGISRQTLYDILSEKQPVTAKMAVRFDKLFDNGASFWINLQSIHDLAVADRPLDVSGIPSLDAQTGEAAPTADRTKGGVVRQTSRRSSIGTVILETGPPCAGRQLCRMDEGQEIALQPNHYIK